MGGVCSTYEGTESCIRDLVGKSEGKGPLGRPMLRWEDNNKMGIQEVEK